MTQNHDNWERFFAELGKRIQKKPPTPAGLETSELCPPLSRFALVTRQETWTEKEREHFRGCDRCRRLLRIAAQMSRVPRPLSVEELRGAVGANLLAWRQEPGGQDILALPAGHLTEKLVQKIYGDAFSQLQTTDQLAFYWEVGLELLAARQVNEPTGGATATATNGPGGIVETGQLDELERKIYVLNEGAGRSLDEIALLLGLTEEEVTRRRRGIRNNCGI